MKWWAGRGREGREKEVGEKKAEETGDEEGLQKEVEATATPPTERGI